MAITNLAFDIHGLILKVRTDYSLLVEMVAEELHFFRIKKNSKKADIYLNFTTLPQDLSVKHYPSHFVKYKEMARPIMTQDTLVHRYARTLITVISHLNKHRMEAAVAPDPSLFPDPACHCCLTQPISPWLKKKNFFFIHAGCVADNDKGILIIGHSRAGKSTLALSAVKAGFKFFSDEQPLLTAKHGHVQAYPFPRRIRLDRSVAPIFRELDSIRDASKNQRLVFHIEDIWPKSIGDQCTPRLMIFPKFQSRGRFRLNRIHPSSAMARLLQDDHFVWYQEGSLKPISNKHLTLFEQLVKQTTAFEMHYGTHDITKIPVVFRRILNG